MKLLAYGDIHLDWTTGGFERFDEGSRALDQVESYAASRGVTHCVFLGDLSDPDDEALCHRAVARAVEHDRRMREAGVRVDWVVGNHDVIEDGRGSHTLMAIAAAGGSVYSRPGNRIVHGYGDRVEFVFLPYGGLGGRYDPDRFVRQLAESHRMGLKGGSLVVCGHATLVPGTGKGSEATDLARGRDLAFPLEACRELAAAGGYGKVVLLNGHVHRRTVDGPVLTPGSLARLTHGEQDHEPGFLVIEA